mmetsp:Transcript_17594/g.38080  ORF Transcript_17594/g.38080 Transcript_17594/m.38080 type:complete len:944 (+) Transcript_17594:190-3021(+)
MSMEMEVIDLCESSGNDSSSSSESSNDSSISINSTYKSDVDNNKKKNDGPRSLSQNDDDTIISISSTEEDVANKVEMDNGGGEKKGGAFTNSRKLPKRKRIVTNRLIDTVAKKSQLACERECASEAEKVAAKKGRATCCTNVESIAKSKRRTKLPANVSSSIAIAHGKILADSHMKSSDERSPNSTVRRMSSMFDDEGWWHKDQLGTKIPAAAKRKKQDESRGGQSVPVSLVSFNDDDQSISSTVTLESSDSVIEIDLTGEESDSCEYKQEGSTLRVVTPQLQCPICDSHVHHHQIDELLGDWKEVNQVDEQFRIDFVTRFKVLLQSIEDDSCDGTSIFYHTCEWDYAPNPIFTVAKLIQLFDVICNIVAMVLRQSTQKNTSSSLLFRPWRKSSPKDCGVIIQMLRIATFEIINSREDFVTPESPRDIDRIIAVTFGLQSLQTMARNAYFESKTKLQDNPMITFRFHDQPLESLKRCIKRNCQVERRPLIVCKLCGVRFHKSCLGASENTDDKLDKRCTCCAASARLLDVSSSNNLSDIYSLVVEKGASPLQPLLFETTRNETALHAALRTNNYDLASMLMFGSYLLLNCDERLIGWNLPEMAWGKDDKLCTPFKSGIDTIIKNMDVRPPVEILLLLCGRGAQERPKDILKALQTRERMMLVMKGLDNRHALLKSDISMGLEPLPIPVISNSGSMPSFIYVSRNIESRSTAMRWFDCRCGKGKQLAPFEGGCTTTSTKYLHQKQCIPPSWKAYCNYLCESRTRQIGSNGWRKCDCQLAEDGVHHGLEVFETPDGRGFGVRTARGVTITKNQILCHYTGEVITSQEAKRRDQEYYANSHTGSYILDMDEKGEFCIDATKFRSVAALINHSCSEPNCELFRALGNHLDANFPFLGLRAKEDIGELTELQFNYVRGSSGQKPAGFCFECKGVHCLCQDCTYFAHRK